MGESWEIKTDDRHYRIAESPIWVNGARFVFSATADEFSFRVVIKLLQNSAAEHEKARFKQELELLRSLPGARMGREQEPFFVPLLDTIREAHLTETDFLLGYVMPHCLPLDEYVRQRGGKLPEKEAAQIVHSLALTVDFLANLPSKRGVIHRDIKPGNVLKIPNTNDWALSDLGLAKQIDKDGALVKLTATGSTGWFGTPGYAAPEMQSGNDWEVDATTDLFSLGCTLYRLVVGRAPFPRKLSGDETTVEFSQAFTELIDDQRVLCLRDSDRRLSKDVEAIVDLLLVKRPDKREYRTGKQLAEHLERFINGKEVPVRPLGFLEKRVRWCQAHPVGTTVISAVVAVVLVTASYAWHYMALSEDLLLANKSAADSIVQKDQALTELSVANRNLEASYIESMHRLVGIHLANGKARIDDGDMIAAVEHLQAAVDASVSNEPMHADNLARLNAAKAHVPQMLSSYDFPSSNGIHWHQPTGEFSTWNEQEILFWKAEGNDCRRLPTQANGETASVVAVNSTSDCFAVASVAGTIVVYDLKTFDQISEFTTDESVVALSLNATGDLLAVSTESNKVQVIDPDSGSVVQEIERLPDIAQVLHFWSDSDADYLSVGFGGSKTNGVGGVKTIDLSNGEDATPSIKHSDDVLAIANVQPPFLISGDWKGKLSFWDNEGKVYSTVDHFSPVRALKYYEEKNVFISIADTEIAFVWPVYYSQAQPFSLVHPAKVTAVDIAPNGDVVTLCFDGKLRVWNLSPVPSVVTMLPSSPTATGLAISTDGLLSFVGASGSVETWDYLCAVAPEVTIKSSGFSFFDLHDNGRKVTLQGRDQATVFRQYSNEGWLVSPGPAAAAHPSAWYFSPDGKHYALNVGIPQEGSENRWSGTFVGEVSEDKIQLSEEDYRYPNAIWGAPSGFSSDGNMLRIVQPDERVCWYDAAPPHALLKQGEVIRYTHNGRLLKSAKGNVTVTLSPDVVRIFDNEQLKERCSFETTFDASDSKAEAAVAADGSRVAISSDDETVSVWDISHEARKLTDLEIDSDATAIEFNSDSTLLAVATSSDRTVHIWDIENEQRIAEPLIHDDRVNHIRFGPADQLIATAAGSSKQRKWGMVRVWCVESGIPLSPWLRHEEDVTQVEFDPSGEFLWTMVWQGNVRKWRVMAAGPDHD